MSSVPRCIRPRGGERRREPVPRAVTAHVQSAVTAARDCVTATSPKRDRRAMTRRTAGRYARSTLNERFVQPRGCRHMPEDPFRQFTVTYRGTVYPWQCDHMGHMNVMWYTAKFDEASWQLLAMLGLTRSRFRQDGTGMAGGEQPPEYT